MYNESVNFWFIRDNEDQVGKIHFNIECEKLFSYEKSQSFDFIRNFLEENCLNSLKEWMKQSGLTKDEVLDILVPRLYNAKINVITIKTDKVDEERKKWNKEIFDKISIN